jgi:hypothetical protein
MVLAGNAHEYGNVTVAPISDVTPFTAPAHPSPVLTPVACMSNDPSGLASNTRSPSNVSAATGTRGSWKSATVSTVSVTPFTSAV